MRVLIQTAGSAGDVHPLLALGRALHQRGHDVRVWANEHFAPHVQRAGLEHRAAGTEELFHEVIADPALWHPRRGLRVVFSMVQRHLLEQAEALRAEVLPGDTVIVAPTLGLAGLMVREKERVPTAIVHLAPAAFPSLHRVPRYAGSPLGDRSPRWCKRLLFALADAVTDRMIRPGHDAARARWGLAPVRRVFGRHIHTGDVLIGLFPAWFAPPQPDWPAHVELYEFPRFDEAETRPVHAALARWLDAGDPPLAFTAGSANLFTQRFFEVSIRAARSLGRRALLLSPTPHREPLPPDVHHATYAPFSRVLPRCAAFVSHGGIGSCAQGLAAGVPQLAAPMGFDQFDNASRLVDLGVGEALPMRRYRRAGRVADALARTLEHAPRAQALARERFTTPPAIALARVAQRLERLLATTHARPVADAAQEDSASTSR